MTNGTDEPILVTCSPDPRRDTPRPSGVDLCPAFVPRRRRTVSHVSTGNVDNRPSASHNQDKMAHLEFDRVAREDLDEARDEDLVAVLCPECGAKIILRMTGESSELCGACMSCGTGAMLEGGDDGARVW